jgi:HAE1 family hydrophobic/amphiphilic exporter-1
MKGLIRFALSTPVFVNLIFIMLMVWGVVSLLVMPVERYPNVNFGKVVISTFYPGATPTEVETLITQKIEDGLEDLANVEYIQSTSFRERSSVMVKFLDDTDYDRGYDDLRFKVLSIMGELPAGIDPPTFDLIDVNDWLPVVSVNLVGNRTNRALTLMAEEMRVPLHQITGVDEVKLQGEYTREFHLLLDPQRMTRLGVSFQEVTRALTRSNVSFPAGDMITRVGEFALEVDHKFRTREQVMGTIIRKDGDGSFVRVADVTSRAELSFRDPFIITTVNGKECVTLQVLKTRDGNALDIIEEVHRVLDEFAERLDREQVQVVLTQDSTVNVSDSIRTLGSNLLLGICLVFVLIWLFMGLRNSCLTTVGVPFAFLLTMVIMRATGNSLNEVSLFAFVLVSGIIVDDAIMVVENIFRHLQEGRPLFKAVVEGTTEVFLPIIAATLTTVAAFMPMLIMTGSTGEFFAIVPKAVSFALLASVIECLFILPTHYLEWGPRTKNVPSREQEFWFMKRLRLLTGCCLGLTLRFRFLSIAVVTLLFAGAVVIAALSFSGKVPLIRVTFFPDDYSLYYVEMEGPAGTPIEAMSSKLEQVSVFLMNDGPAMIKSAAGFAGFYFSEDYEPIFGSNLGHVAVTLPSTRDRQFEDAPVNDPVAHLETIRNRLEPFTHDGTIIRIRPEKDGPPAGKDVNIRVIGYNDASVSNLSETLLEFLRSDPATANDLLDLGTSEAKPHRVITFVIDPDRAAEHGVGVDAAAGLAASVLDGGFFGTFRTRDEDVDIRVKIDPDMINEPVEGLDIPLLENPTGPIRLRDLARMKTSMEQGSLERFRTQRAVTITANIRAGSNLSTPAVVRMVKTFFFQIQNGYPGATLDFAGEFENTRRSYTSLTYAFAIALLIIYTILATQFRSYFQPLIIMSAVVFALIGIIYGIFLTRTLFTINSFIAIVGVTGVVVNDSLVLIEFINKRYREGMDRRQAILEGVRIRLRPILLTTLTTTLGLLPMALGIPEYSLVWGAMASTFVTGLCTSTFLTVLMVPVQWDLLMQFVEWRERRQRSHSNEPLQGE